MGSELNLGHGHLDPEEDPGAKPLAKPFSTKSISLPNKAKCPTSSAPW